MGKAPQMLDWLAALQVLMLKGKHFATNPGQNSISNQIMQKENWLWFMEKTSPGSFFYVEIELH